MRVQKNRKMSKPKLIKLDIRTIRMLKKGKKKYKETYDEYIRRLGKSFYG